jgi:hypothetical protein
MGVGDQVAVVGLFRNHFGKERDLSITRMGNIAMMREEPVFTDYCGYIDAYLIEAHSISGLSGSPVWFLNYPLRPAELPDKPNHMTLMQLEHGKAIYYLMGLIHGHFDIKNLNEDTVVDDERETSDGINTGIGVVVPVEKVIETIRDHPDLKKHRQEIIDKAKKDGGAATADFLNDEEASGEENPRHLEDFRRLVDVAARKRPQGDQT